MAELWVSTEELESLLGADYAAVLCRNMGGVPFYVPKEGRPDHPLAMLLGMSGLTALSREFAATWITVPTGKHNNPQKPLIIAGLEDGRSQAAIARETGVTERYVRIIAANLRGPKQLTLPLFSA